MIISGVRWHNTHPISALHLFLLSSSLLPACFRPPSYSSLSSLEKSSDQTSSTENKAHRRCESGSRVSCGCRGSSSGSRGLRSLRAGLGLVDDLNGGTVVHAHVGFWLWGGCGKGDVCALRVCQLVFDGGRQREGG